MSFPIDPWDDLSPGLQDIFWETRGTEVLEESGLDTRYYQTLYATGWGYHASEYESAGITEDQVTAARQAFLDGLGLPWDRFDWDAWRDEMGYNEK